MSGDERQGATGDGDSGRSAGAGTKATALSMVVEAVRELRDSNGSSLQAVKKFVSSRYDLDPAEALKALKKAQETGELVADKRRYKLVEGVKEKPAKGRKPKDVITIKLKSELNEKPSARGKAKAVVAVAKPKEKTPRTRGKAVVADEPPVATKVGKKGKPKKPSPDNEGTDTEETGSAPGRGPSSMLTGSKESTVEPKEDAAEEPREVAPASPISSDSQQKGRKAKFSSKGAKQESSAKSNGQQKRQRNNKSKAVDEVVEELEGEMEKNGVGDPSGEEKEDVEAKDTASAKDGTEGHPLSKGRKAKPRTTRKANYDDDDDDDIFARDSEDLDRVEDDWLTVGEEPADKPKKVKVAAKSPTKPANKGRKKGKTANKGDKEASDA